MNKQAYLEEVYSSAFEDELEKVAKKPDLQKIISSFRKKFPGKKLPVLSQLRTSKKSRFKPSKKPFYSGPVE